MASAAPLSPELVKKVTTTVDGDTERLTAIFKDIHQNPKLGFMETRTAPYDKEYKLLEKSIRQIWGTPDLVVTPYLVIGGADAKWFATSAMAKNVYRFTAVRVESAADTARWHGVNERVLVDEYANSIGFFHQFILNAQDF